MSEEITTSPKQDGTLQKIRASITLKFILLGLILLVIQIPIALIHGLKSERESRSNEVVNEIASKWGGRQNIIGPVLNIPIQRDVVKQVTDSDNVIRTKTIKETDYLQIAPESLVITGTMTPEIRYRSIFEVLLYRSSFTIKGNIPAVEEFVREWGEWEFLYDQARLLLSIEDIKGITSVEFKVNGESRKVMPGGFGSLHKGVSVPYSELTAESKEIPFEIQLDLNGCENLFFYPVGQSTSLSISSTWPSPSFTGGFLPQKRNVSPTGFSAEWIVNDFNRDCPSSWLAGGVQFSRNEGIGLSLLKPVNHYSLVHRAISYELLICLIVLLAFLIAERICKSWIHPLQYFIAALSLVLFYLLLLSFSEHLSFGQAYVVSTLIIVLLGGFYAKLIFGNWRLSGAMATAILSSYTLIYFILQLEDYALLAGSLVLAVFMAIVMAFTGKLNQRKASA